MMDTNTTYIPLALILILGFIIRLPYLNFPIDEDFGFYSYPAYFRNRGVRLVKDIWGNIFPFLLYFKIGINKICKGNIKKTRLFFAAYNSLTIIAVYHLASLLNGSITGLLAALLYSIFSSAPHLGSYSINAEKYYLLPLTIAACLLLEGLDKQADFMLTLAGIFTGIAFLMKPVVIVSMGAFALYTVIYGGWGNGVLFSIAALVIIAIHFVIVTFIFRHDLKTLWTQNKLRLISTFNYIGLPLDISERLVVDLIPLLKETIFVWMAVIPCIILTMFERTDRDVFFLFWLLASVITLVGQRSFWQYHYIPIIHIFSIGSAVSLVNMFSEFDKHSLSKIFFIFLPLSLFLVYSLKNLFGRFHLYKKNPKRFLNSFRKMDQYLYVPRLAEYIKKNTDKTDFIYVWGVDPIIYLLSDRQSCEKSVFDFVGPFKKEHEYQYDETFKGIIEKKPKFIIQIFVGFDIEFLNKLTGLLYRVDRVFFNRFIVYRLSEDQKNEERVYRENEPWELKKGKLEMLTTGLRKSGIFDYYLKQGMDNKYVEEFKEALAINPYDVVSLVYLGIYYRRINDFEMSLHYLKKALPVKQHRAWVYTETAKTYESMEDNEKTQDALKKGRRWLLLPYSVGLMIQRGIVYRLLGDTEKSIKTFIALLKIHPPVDSLYFELALTYKENGALEKSIEYFHKELALYPQGEWKNFELAMMYRETGKLTESIEYFYKELALYPQGEGKHYELGLAYGMMEKLEEAIKYYKIESVKYPEKPYSYYQIASLSKKIGSMDESAKYFKIIISSKNTSDQLKAGGHYHLGTILMQKNENKEAVSKFKKCLELMPNHKMAKEAINTIEIELLKPA